MRNDETSTSTTSGKPHVGFSCDFEESICDWEIGSNDGDKFKWERTNVTSCQNDHPENCPGNEEGGSQGYFMYIDAGDDNKANVDASLISPPSQEDIGDCFLFLFNMKVMC